MVGVISSGSPLRLKANPIAAKILPPPNLLSTPSFSETPNISAGRPLGGSPHLLPLCTGQRDRFLLRVKQYIEEPRDKLLG